MVLHACADTAWGQFDQTEELSQGKYVPTPGQMCSYAVAEKGPMSTPARACPKAPGAQT